MSGMRPVMRFMLGLGVINSTAYSWSANQIPRRKKCFSQPPPKPKFAKSKRIIRLLSRTILSCISNSVGADDVGLWDVVSSFGVGRVCALGAVGTCGLDAGVRMLGRHGKARN